MGMSSSVKVALELKRSGLFENKYAVMDMGAQEIHMQYHDFLYLMDGYGIKYDASKFEDLKYYPGHPRLSTKAFWSSLGFQITHSLDIQPLHDSIQFDLNYPFEQREHWEKYDLVTDFGNNEHPFNVAEAYRTMHRLCRKGGYIWIDQGVINGNGYFNFDLSFFEGVAAANNYGILYSAFVVATTDKKGQASQFHIPCSREILDLFDFSKLNYVGVSYLFRKNTDEDFRFPYQGTVHRNNPGHSYRVAYVSDRFPPERYYIPITPSFSGYFLAKELIKKIRRKFWG